MPNVSKKGKAMPSSPIRKLVPFAEAAKAEGVHIYHLNIGQPDIQTPPNAMDVIRNTELEVVAYSHSAGNVSYRNKLVDYYKHWKVNLDPDNFIVTTGASEAISFAVQSCLDNGDELIVPEPFYANYNGFAIGGGVKIVPVTASIEDGFALPPIEKFEELVTARTKGIMICNPSNPTGYLYTKEELLVLKDIAIKHDLFLFVDEVYREFRYGNEPFTSIMSLDGLDDHAIVFDSVSKRYSACGARVGALVTRNKEVLNTAMKFAQARLSPPTLAQILAEAALDAPASYLSTALAEYEKRRNLVYDRLNAMPGVVCPNIKGAFYAFVKLPVQDTEHFCQWLLDTFRHEDQTVMIAPGGGFYATDGLGKQEVRIAYVLNTSDLSKAMDCLEAALEVYPYRIEV